MKPSIYSKEYIPSELNFWNTVQTSIKEFGPYSIQNKQSYKKLANLIIDNYHDWRGYTLIKCKPEKLDKTIELICKHSLQELADRVKRNSQLRETVYNFDEEELET